MSDRMGSQSQESRIKGLSSDEDIEKIIDAAARHDLQALTSLIDECSFSDSKAVDVRHQSSGNTPLHAAISSCAPENSATASETDHSAQVQDAEKTVRLLLENGAIWNQLNNSQMTPGCIAYDLGLDDLYRVMVDAGVRAEMLLSRLEEYQQLDDDEQMEEGDNDDEVQAAADSVSPAKDLVTKIEDESSKPAADANEISHRHPESTESAGDATVTSATYLSSVLSMDGSKILDDQQNGVMMAWEKDIMSRSADAILTVPGMKVLNIGFGMGIFDSLVQSHANSPSEHHIIEAHPDVLKDLERKGWLENAGIFVHAGKWQDVLPTMIGDGLCFDAIFYDTFAESYKDFKDFFSEYVLGLLDSDGKWSYFNGMGADRQISYDVYQKIVEIDLYEAGYEVEWAEVDLPDLESEWDGVRRKYWNVAKYRLPVCKFLD
jgi:type IV protein arginine methyltransferase